MAAGDHLFTLVPVNNEPPASNAATPDTRNSRPCLDFIDQTTIEVAVFKLVMPEHYSNATGITLQVEMGSADDQTTGEVLWRFSLERIINDSTDLDADSFGSTTTLLQTAPGGTSQVAIDEHDISAGANMDSVVKNDPFRLKVERFSTDASDDMSGDAELYSIYVTET